MPNITVIKRSGEQVAFSEEKVLRSMHRVGVPDALQPQVLQHIKERISGNSITTDEIFSHILEFLKEKDKKSSIRFNLRQAVFDLGPTGFPFEKYIERVFQSQGYHAQVDVILTGECVNHEIDVLIEKDGKKEIVEAKFHNQTVGKTDVQVVLYVYARFLDVKEKNNIDGVWVITNTKLTTDAIDYAKCKGIKVIGWNYPEVGNLQDFVENPKMYPVTILNSLSGEEKQRLLENNVVLSCDLLNYKKEELSEKFLIDDSRLTEALDSAKIICGESHAS